MENCSKQLLELYDSFLINDVKNNIHLDDLNSAQRLSTFSHKRNNFLKHSFK